MNASVCGPQFLRSLPSWVKFFFFSGLGYFFFLLSNVCQTRLVPTKADLPVMLFFFFLPGGLAKPLLKMGGYSRQGIREHEVEIKKKNSADAGNRSKSDPMIRTRSIIYIYIYIRRRERVCTFLSLESCCRVRVVGRKPFRVCQSSNSETRRPGFDFFLLVPKINQLFFSFSGGEYTQSDDGGGGGLPLTTKDQTTQR